MKRCWNCRAQKSACDRTIPTCQNCEKRGRVCLGYGLKLSWPRETDGKRFISQSQCRPLPVVSQNVHFIDVPFRDVGASLTGQEAISQYDHSAYRLHWFPNPLSNNISTVDPFLAANSYSPVSRLLCSCSDADELYGLLIRISQDDDDRLASTATRSAISALSFQHMGLETEAATHHLIAIRALQGAIETPAPSIRAMQMIAASMLLSIFETLTFDTSSLSWSIFFCGTKRIERLVTDPERTYYGDEALILDWIFYHDVMYKFSIRHWRDKNPDQIALAGENKIISKAASSTERQMIVPLLGCSLELLDILCQIIDNVYDPHDLRRLSRAHLQILEALELRLKRLKQYYSSLTGETLVQNSLSASIAEIWRLAALIYLYRVAKGDTTNPDCSKVFVQALDLLDKVEYCDRPWPIFIIALHPTTDSQRSIILTALQRSLSRRPLGSMAVVNRLVRDAWIQQDLSQQNMDPLALYGLIISRNRVPPCFT